MQIWENDCGQGLPAGPWNDEPDKAHWVDEATGLDCLIHRNRLGVLCGYVGVPPGHLLYESDYDLDFDVHGGLTYSAFCQEGDDPAFGICHVPQPGRPEKVWWLGFDCGHMMDLMPAMIDNPFYGELGADATYRTFGYVKSEAERLAVQVIEAGA